MQPWPKYSPIAVLRSVLPKNGYLEEVTLGHVVLGDCVGVKVGAAVGPEVAVGNKVAFGPDVGGKDNFGPDLGRGIVGPDVALGNEVVVGPDVGPDVAVGDEVAVGPELAVGDRVGVRQFVTAHHGPDLLVGWFLFWHAVWRNIIATDPYGQLSPK